MPENSGHKRCPGCDKYLNVDATTPWCWRCEKSAKVRKCRRCYGRLSAWNRGEFCNPCWNSMGAKERATYRSEHYNPEPEWRRERREDDAIKRDNSDQSGDT